MNLLFNLLPDSQFLELLMGQSLSFEIANLASRANTEQLPLFETISSSPRKLGEMYIQRGMSI